MSRTFVTGTQRTGTQRTESQRTESQRIGAGLWLSPTLATLLSFFWVFALAAPALAQPVITGLQPADGTVLASGAGTLTGTVTGAATLSIDGDDVTIGAGGSFSWPFDLSEGSSLIQIYSEDGGGQSTSLVHQLVLDTQNPQVSVTQPSSSVVGSQPVQVAGTYFEPHLTSLTVAAGGVTSAATASGGTWDVSVPLVEGPQALTISAQDSLGHQTSFPVTLTLDTIAPTLTVTESGALFGGGLFTRPVTPVVSASDATDLTLELVLDGAPFVSGTTVSDEGSHTLDAIATDDAGNVTAVEIDFVIDTTAPTIGAIQPAAGTVLGAADVTLQIETGSGAYGADLVRVTGLNGSVESAGSGLFTVGPVSLSEGTNDLLVEAFDDAGNRATRTHRLVRDMTPPVLTVSAPVDGDVVSAATVPAQGVAQDARLQSVTVNGVLANLIGEGWSVADVPLANGTNILTVVATDTVGNQTTQTVTVERDTAAPVFQVLVDGVELVSGATFSGPVSPVIQVDEVQFPGATVVATLDGSAFTSGTEVSADGSHELSVTVTSGAGVSSSRLLIFTIDQQTPAISNLQPAAGHLQREAELSLSGTVSGAQVVTVDGQAATMFQGSFSAGPFTLAEGERTFTIVATGANGLETTVQHSVERDSTPPQVAVSSPADGALVGDVAITVSGTALDPNLDSVTVNETPTVISASTWNASGVPLAEGSTTLTARAEDAAGNVSEVTRTVILDTEAPQLTITDPAPGSLVPDATYEVRGTVTEEHLDRIDVEVTAVSTGDTSSVQATVEGGTFFVQVPLAEGTNQITATARDLLGATDTDSASIERDSEAPQVRIVVPGDGESVNDPSLEVRGTVNDEEGISVRVNGLVAVIDRGSWVVAGLDLSQGENLLLARATDAQGNEGVHTRSVILDQEAPTFLSADPASGALALPVDTVFRLEFSEPLAEPEEGSWVLTTGGGAPLAATATVDGSDLRITPAAPLPSEQTVVLTLSAALTDLAGNALANPPAPLSYQVVDEGAPDAVVLDFEPARFLCSPEVVLSGTAEPATRVEAEGGASTAWERAGVDGTFLLSVELLQERLNRLELTATDAEGNVSPATVVEVVHDCTGPEVATSELLGQTLTIDFTEAVDETTVTTSSINVSDAAGSLAFTISTSGDEATLTLASAPAGSVLLDVGTGVRDLASNALAYPYRRVFGDASGAQSFVSGTVIDDATGRPLAGATVQITATDGQALGEPLPQQTTGSDGRFLIPVASGTHDLAAARPGYTPVFRIVTTTAGEGTNVFDPRLSPMSSPATVSTSGGTVAADEIPESTDPAPQLTLPSGALAQSSAVSLTQLGEQALPALLPYGWSPRGAVWVDSVEDFLASGTLSLPVRSTAGPTPAGTLLHWVTLDVATLQWQVAGQATVANGQVQTSVPSIGAYVAVEADTGTNAPPAAVVGQVLGSSPSPVGGEVESASLTFDPEVVLPTQRARATATYTLAAGMDDAPSGLPLTLVIEEELELLDGSILREAPYRTDVIVYRDDLGTPSSEFWLRPSETARSEPIQLGGEDVTILPYGDETVRGNVLGPEGGAVLSDEGDQLDVPAGALTGPAAIVLERQTAADLPLATPRGAIVDAVLDLDMGGARFELPADLSIAMSTPPAAGSKGLLLQVVEVETDQGLVTTFRVLTELVPTTGGWETAAIDPLDLAWPGVRTEGQLAAVQLTEPHGFVRGEVVSNGGQPVDGAVVSSDSVDWVQVTDLEGRYVLPLPLGEHVVNSRSPQTGNAAQVAVTVSTEGERIDLDPTLQIVAPWIAEVTPADGSQGIPIGVEPTVRFSEPVDRTTLPGGLELLLDGVSIQVEFDHQGDFVRLLPAATLVPGQTYELRIGAEIRDLDGYALNGILTTSFRTEDDPSTSGQLDRSKVKTLAPDSQGIVTVIGQSGAVPGNTLVYVENLTSYSTTESVTSTQDGAFQLTIGAALDDRLLLHVLIQGGSEDLMTLGPFLSADEKSAYVPEDGGDWTTIEGLGLEVQPGTFTRPTWVRAEMRASGPVETPEGFDRLMNFKLDFSGAQAYRSVLVTLPATGTDPANEYLLGRYIEALGFQTWMVVDLLRIDGATLTNARVGEGKSARAGEKHGGLPSSSFGTPDRHRVLTLNEASQLRENPDLVMFDAVVRTRARSKSMVRPTAASAKSATPPPDPFQSQIRLLEDGFFEVSYASKESLSWLALEAQVGILIRQVEGFGAAIPFPASLLTDLGIHWILLPVLQGEAYELEVRDLTSGYQLYRELQPAPTQPLVIFDADDFGDGVPPFPTHGSPIRIASMVVHDDMEPIALPRDTTVTLEGSTLSVTGGIGSADAEVQVKIQQVINNLAETPKKGQSTSTALGSFQVSVSDVEAGELYLLVIGAQIGGGEHLEISFSEALADPVTGLELSLLEGETKTPIDETVRLQDNGHRALVYPSFGWRKGTYELRFGPSLMDVALLPWNQELTIQLKVPESVQLDPIETERIADMARLGNLVLAATNSEGLKIYDMSHPAVPRHYLKQDRGIVFPQSNLVRGVDVDSHGRVFIVGGGQSTFGQMKLIDLTKIDPDLISEEEASFDAEVAKGFRGSTLISDPLNTTIDTALRAGLPRRVAVANNDDVEQWIIQEKPAPDGVTIEYTNGTGTLKFDEESEITVRGTGEQKNVPITLRNATRGRWDRVEADVNGDWEITMDVARYDHLVLQRSRGAFAYVAIEGVGVALVDILDFFDEEITQASTASNLVSYAQPLDVIDDTGETPCDPNRPSLNTIPTDIGLIIDQTSDTKLSLFSLIQGHGFAIQTAPFSDPGQLEKVSSFCGAVENQATLTAMDVVSAYRLDLDGDGEILEEDKTNPDFGTLIQEKEVRDYVVLGHASGYVLIVDVTDRTQPLLKAQINLGEGVRVSSLVLDERSQRVFVSAFGQGILVVDFSSLPSGNPRQLIDEDHDGVDDRVLETISLGDEEVRDVFLLPEFGVALAGSNENLTGLLVGEPEISFLAVDNGPLRKAYQVAPFGVPTAPEESSDSSSPMKPGLVRVQVILQGLATEEAELVSRDMPDLEIELLGVSPELGEVDGAGDHDDLPPTSYVGLDSVTLERMSENPWEPGYSIYLSDPMLVVADLIASSAYELSDDEKDECNRCDLMEEDVYPGGVPEEKEDRLKEILSGHYLLARPAGDLAEWIPSFYEDSAFGEIQGLTESVPWDITPSLKQEPVLNASYAQNGELLGTVLHSGEQTWSATDLVVPAVGFDLAFTRHYRSQTLGFGPLGPGWDHSFRTRLRVLPNDSVEFFDGTGRRELFEWKDEEYHTPEGRFAQLNRTAVGFTLAESAGIVRRFDRHGRLRSVFPISRINDTRASEIVFSYDASSRVSEIRVEAALPTPPPPQEPRQYYLAFEYDEEGLLTKIRDSVSTDSGTREYSYSYDQNGRLDSAVSPEVDLGTGQPVTVTTNYGHQLGLPTELDEFLHTRDSLVSITDAYDNEWIRLRYVPGADGRHSELNEQTLSSQSETGSLTSVRTLAFIQREPAVHAEVSDGRMKVWTYHHSEQGHPKKLIDPVGNEWSWEYAAHDHVEHGLVTKTVSPRYAVFKSDFVDLGESKDTGPTVLDNRISASTATFDLGQYSPPDAGADGDDACRVPQDGLNGSTLELSTGYGYEGIPTNLAQPGQVQLSTGIKSVFHFDTSKALFTETRLEDASQLVYTERKVEEFNEWNQPERVFTSFLRSPPSLEGGSATKSEDPHSRSDVFEYDEPNHNLKKVIRDQDDFGIEFVLEDVTELKQVHRSRAPSGDDTQSAPQISKTEYNELGWPLKTCRVVENPEEICTRMIYDKNGRVVETIEPSENGDIRTLVSYGWLGQVVKTRRVSPTGEVGETREYDENLNLTKVDPTGLWPQEIEYDDRNLVIRRRVPDAPSPVEETFTYNGDGQLLTYTDARGHTWSTEYDGFGRPMKQTDPGGTYTLHAYDEFGRMNRIRSCDVEGSLLAESTMTHDPRGLLTTRTIATEIEDGAVVDSVTERFEYNGQGQMTLHEAASGAKQLWRYDDLGRLVEAQQGDSLTAGTYRVEFDLDDRGNIVRETHHPALVPGFDAPPPSFVTDRTYDGLDRLTSETNGESETTTFHYDPQSQLIRTVRPGNVTTSASFDWLGRPLRTTRPENQEVTYAYTDSGSSRTVEMTDGRANLTKWTYNGLGQMTRVDYPDETFESYEYDTVGNPKSTLRRDGLQLTKSFDSLNRLQSVSYSPTHPEEPDKVLLAYGYDPLGRLEWATGSGTTTTIGYDPRSLPVQVLADVSTSSTYVFGLTKNYTASGLPADVTYPSQLRVAQGYDPDDQLAAIGVGPENSEDLVGAYGWWTPGLPAALEAPGRPSSEWFPDLAGRPRDFRTYLDIDDPIYAEVLSRQDRGLVDGRAIRERSGTVSERDWTFDNADQLKTETGTFPDAILETYLGGGSSFDYDAAQGLTKMTYQSACGPTSTTLDIIQGNRVSSVGGVDVTWSDTGNLESKGDLTYTYDFRDRLEKVLDGSEILAEYKYDALDRRVLKTIGGVKHATVWDGWRPIEDYRLDGDQWMLTERLTHGAGLDEVLQLELGYGANLDAYRPVYNSSGHVALLLGSNNELVERYFYTPFGDRWVWSRGELPRVEQVRLESDEIFIELSEELKEEALAAAIAAGDIEVQGLNSSVNQDISLVSVEGRMAGRRIRITLDAPDPEDLPGPGTGLTVSVAGAALRDNFDGTPAAQDVGVVVTWGSPGVYMDIAPPEMEEACLTGDGKVRIVFSEPVAPGGASQVLINGSSPTWTQSADGYTLTSESTHTTGSHSLGFGAGAFDLAGQSLTDTSSISFGTDAKPSLLAVTDDASISQSSLVGNPYGFHGLRHDEVTGFIFARHRYLDPELGRFLTTDPLGYVDGPNLYQFALNNPVNFSDPMGQCVGSLQNSNFCQGIASWMAGLLGDSAEESEADALEASFVRKMKRAPTFGEPVAFDWAGGRYFADGQWWDTTSRGVGPRVDGGFIDDIRINTHRIANQERGQRQKDFVGLVLHKTVDTPVSKVLRGWQTSRAGTHFVIARNGAVYQVADLNQVTWHTGKLKARCVQENTCSAAEAAAYRQIGWAPKTISRREHAKQYPDRYPSNLDSIGIELVAAFLPARSEFEPGTWQQIESMRLLIGMLQSEYGLTGADTFDHGTISYRSGRPGHYEAQDLTPLSRRPGMEPWRILGGQPF